MIVMKYLFLLAFTLKLVSINAQYLDSIQGIQLDSMVYTSTRLATPIDQVGRSISVITKEQLQSLASNSLAEILSVQTGLSIIGSGQTPGQLQNIFGRGNNSNQSTILIDGMRITNPFSTNNILDLSELSIAHIDRIEIIRGNHSSLYGPSSVGSTINLISINPYTNKSNSSFNIKTGVFGKNTYSFEPSVHLYFQNKKGWYTSLGTYFNQTKGINATIDTISDTSHFKFNRSEQDHFTKLDHWAMIGKRTKNWSASLSYRHHFNKADLDKGAFQDDDNYISRQTRDLIGIKANYQIKKSLSLEITSSISGIHYRYTDDSSIVNSSGITDQTFTSGNYYGLSINNDVVLSFKQKTFNFLLGLSQNYDNLKYDNYFYSGQFDYESKLNFENHALNLVGIFGQIQLSGSSIRKSFEKLQCTLNGRQSYSNQFGSFFTFGVNPSYKLNNGLLYMNYSTGFTTPSLYQLYSGEIYPESNISRGNPFLRSESSSTFEFGIKQRINQTSSLLISVFKNYTKNAIDYVYLWNAFTPVSNLSFIDYRGDTYVNLGRLKNTGIELEYTTKLSHSLSLSLNVSLIDGQVKYKSSGSDTSHIGNNQIQIFNSGIFVTNQNKSSTLTRRPSTSNINISYHVCDPLKLSISYKYVSTKFDNYYNELAGPFGALNNQLLEDYQLMNLYINYRLNSKFNCIIQVENIFNKKYSEILGYASKGRGLYLTLGYSMK